MHKEVIFIKELNNDLIHELIEAKYELKLSLLEVHEKEITKDINKLKDEIDQLCKKLKAFNNKYK